MKNFIRKRFDIFLLVAAILVACGMAARGQQPAKQLTPAQEAEAAQKALTTKGQELDAAVAAFQIAWANRNAAYYKVLAESGIKASDCGITQTQWGAVPACVKINSDGTVTAVKPEAAKTQPK